MVNLIKLSTAFIFSTFLLGLFIFTVDISTMFNSIINSDYRYYLPAFVMYLFSLIFRTIRWQILLTPVKAVNSFRLFPVVIVGYMANNLLPFRLGELTRAYYTGIREDISKATVLSTIFLERVLDALILLLFIFIIGFFIPLSDFFIYFENSFGLNRILIISVFSLPFILLFTLIVLIAYAPRTSNMIFLKMILIFPEKIKNHLVTLSENLINGLMSVRESKKLLLLFLLSIPIWILESGLFFFVALSFDLDYVYQNYFHMIVYMILITAIVNIGSSIPAAPGGLGLFELIAREALIFSSIGLIDRSLAAGFATLSHAILIFPVIIIGQLILFFSNISFFKLIKSSN